MTPEINLAFRSKHENKPKNFENSKLSLWAIKVDTNSSMKLPI